jgi:hypothetical protein
LPALCLADHAAFQSTELESKLPALCLADHAAFLVANDAAKHDTDLPTKQTS